MFTKSVRLSALTLALGICAGTIAAHATPITAGQSAITPSAIAAGSLGTLLATTSGTATASTFSATYTESVYRGGANPYGANDLAFTVIVTDLGPDAIEKVTMSLFGSFLTDVNYVTGSGAVPTSASRNITGGGVDFNFGAGFGPTALPTTSDQLVIFTNATAYTTGGYLALQDSTNVTVGGTTTTIYMPTTPTVTPEPSSLVLLGTGLVGVAGLARRKFFGR